MAIIAQGQILRYNCPLSNNLFNMIKSSLEQYLDGLSPSSKASYEARITDFKAFEEQNSLAPRDETIVSYFTSLHLTYATSTLWTYYSMLKTYLSLTNKFDIKHEVPQLVKMLKQWQKKEEKKKSQVFNTGEIERYLQDAPSDAKHKLIKAVACIGISGLLRTQELLQLEFKDIERQEQVQEGRTQYMIHVSRKKQVGPKASASFLVTNRIFAAKIAEYIDVFQKEVRLATLSTNYSRINWAAFSAKLIRAAMVESKLSAKTLCHRCPRH